MMQKRKLRPDQVRVQYVGLDLGTNGKQLKSFKHGGGVNQNLCFRKIR